MTIKDIAWTAGFLEGEGSFLYPKKNGSTAIVSAVQVQLEPLERLKNLYGGSIYLKSKTKGRPNEKPRYTWTLTGPSAAGLMMTVFTLLSPRRREQVKNALKEWKSRKPQNKHKQVCVGGHSFNEENTRYYAHPKTGKVGRWCRACKRERYGLRKAEGTSTPA